MNEMYSMKVRVKQEHLKEIAKAVEDMKVRGTEFMIDFEKVKIELTTPNFRLIRHIQKIINGETVTQFKAMKMRINNPDHSKDVQEWLFEQGYKWITGGIQYTPNSYLYTLESGYILRSSIDTEGYFDSISNDEINVQHLDPHLFTKHISPCNPVIKSYREKGVVKSELQSLSTQLKHLDKAIASHDNKQNKRKLDRQRIIEKMEGMLPEGYKIVIASSALSNDSSEYKNVNTFDPDEIVVGSIWRCVEGWHRYTKGKEYTVIGLDYSGDAILENDSKDVSNDCGEFKDHMLRFFKRIK